MHSAPIWLLARLAAAGDPLGDASAVPCSDVDEDSFWREHEAIDDQMASHAHNEA